MDLINSRQVKTGQVRQQTVAALRHINNSQWARDLITD